MFIHIRARAYMLDASFDIAISQRLHAGWNDFAS